MKLQILCAKLKKLGEAIPSIPYPGELGKRVQKDICQEAWQLWLNHQVMLINEYRLNMLEVKDRKFLEEEMQKFLFEDIEKKPDSYVDPDKE